MRKRLLLLAGVVIMVILGVLGALAIFTSEPLIKNGALSQNFDGWETSAGVSIFRDPTPPPKNWRYYWMLVRTGDILHLGDINNDRFAALGAGNTTGSVLSQSVTLDGKSGRYELSFLFAATGDAGTIAV